MDLSTLDYIAAAAAAVGAGAVNSIAGGGTLISFPALVAIGVPAVPANVTNTVSLVPGYVGGAWAQRAELEKQMATARALSGLSAIGGLAGSILLIAIPGHAFRTAVPYLILVSCLLLLFQNRLRTLVGAGAGPDAGPDAGPSARRRRPGVLLGGSVLLSAVYGGFFGAGLGIMLLAVLGLWRDDPLRELNALKQALSFVINLVAAVFFCFSGHVVWQLVPVMAAASVLGGVAGGRLVTRIDAGVLRLAVVVAGVAVAIAFWVG